MVARAFALSATLALVACRSKGTPSDAGPSPSALPSSPSAVASASPSSASSASPSPASSSSASPPATGSFADWLRARLPQGGRVIAKAGGDVAVVHTVSPDETPETIARAYVDLTEVYKTKDLAAVIAADHPGLKPGDQLEIPHLLSAPYKSPDEDRLGWPKDRALKGVFITGIFAGIYWVQTLDRLAARKLNAVVLDGKDYMGPITYPTHAKIALETAAADDPPIPDLARAIRFAHARGIRVLIRISCFHDPWTAKRAPRLSVMGNWGKPFPLGWLDPTNTEAQDYILELANEAINAGADEVQLDYVRFPVQGQGIKSAVLPVAHERSKAMREFVRRVHSVTEAHHIPLSLDIFGVTATGDESDIELLGQDIGVIGDSAEALSPMVYPSHYSPGWHGFAIPGNHPEIIGIGSRAAVSKLEKAGFKNTIIRPWLQASAYKTPAYGPGYILGEIKSAEASGSVGWLMWDPENSYWAVWRALSPVADTKPVKN